MADLWTDFTLRQDEPYFITRILLAFNTVLAALTIPFALSALALSTAPNAGFSVALTAFLLIAHESGGIWLLKQGPDALSYGVLIGSTAVLCLQTMATASYWGQMSKCDPSLELVGVRGYRCSSVAAMQGVSSLGTLIWMIQAVYLAAAIKHRNTVTQGSSGGYTGSIWSNSHSYQEVGGGGGEVPRSQYSNVDDYSAESKGNLPGTRSEL
ncbi:unnamed protein product [Chrysoparadoxa australica]